MRKTTLIALAAALLVSVAACHKDNKTEQLAALDEAYKSGVFSKEEYDARKQALVGPPKAPAAPPKAEPVAAPPPDQPPNPPAQPDVVPAQMPPAPAPAGALPSSAAQPPAPVRQMPRSPAALPAPAPSAAPQNSVARQPAPVRQAPRSPAAPPAQPQGFGQTNGADREDPEPAPLAGCEDAESKSGGAKGVQERFFPAPVEAVRKAAALALKNLDFTIHVDARHQMEASKRRHVGVLGGERLILLFDSVQKSGQSGTRVTGETKKSIVGRLSQKTWTSAVLAQIACNLRTGRY